MSNPQSLPDYYKVLEVSASATPTQIREAYKKASLKHHPDRVSSDSPDRREKTKRFQEINNAYYTLSDPERRKEYDDARQWHSSSSSTFTYDETNTESNANANAPRSWSSFFTNRPEQTSKDQFSSVFEEMMRDEDMAQGPEAQPTTKFWSILGALSGGTLGFIVANLPGVVAGAVAGNRLGAIRDSKGKSVYQVFTELPQSDRAKLLGDLAAKVFAHAVS